MFALGKRRGGVTCLTLWKNMAAGHVDTLYQTLCDH